MSTFWSSLTTEEANELRSRPFKTRNLQGMHLVHRQGLAEKFERFCAEGDPHFQKLNSSEQEFKRHFPLWGFYTDAKTQTAVYRILSHCWDNQGKSVVVLLPTTTPRQINIPSQEIMQVNNWSRDTVSQSSNHHFNMPF